MQLVRRRGHADTTDSCSSVCLIRLRQSLEDKKQKMDEFLLGVMAINDKMGSRSTSPRKKKKKAPAVNTGSHTAMRAKARKKKVNGDASVAGEGGSFGMGFYQCT